MRLSKAKKLTEFLMVSVSDLNQFGAQEARYGHFLNLKKIFFSNTLSIFGEMFLCFGISELIKKPKRIQYYRFISHTTVIK